jgi:hypothetical protein
VSLGVYSLFVCAPAFVQTQRWQDSYDHFGSIRVKSGTWPRQPVEQVKRWIAPLVAFVNMFGPADPADDPGYLELRDRVLRAHGVHAPPPGPTVWIEGPGAAAPRAGSERGGKYE